MSEIHIPETPETEKKDTPENELPTTMPLLAVRDVVVFNFMILPLFVGREKSVLAVDAALSAGRYILICTQKDEDTDEPGPDDLYTVGTVAMIMRMLKMPDGRLKVLVQGVSRARIKRFLQTDPYDLVEIEPWEEPAALDGGPEQEALLRTVREQTERILQLRGIDATEMLQLLHNVPDPGRLADLVAANLRMKTANAQRILECQDPLERLRLVNQELTREVEVATLQAKIQSMAKEGMDKAQRDYFLREQLKAIRKELGDSGGENDEIEELRQALAKAGLPKKVKKEADKQLSRLENMHPDSSEATIVRTYLDWILDLPWKKASKDRIDIAEAAAILDEDHYDLHKVKERILEYLAVRKLNPHMKGPILCFVGPPGVGKTSLGRSIARALGRKFVRMSLGGMRDEAEIRGHRRTYIGAMPGRILQAMKDAGTINPVIMLDEIDKLGTDFRGDPSSALLEVLDPEQNNAFTDHYLGVPYDLSKVMFICTANMLDTIPSALLDRMEVIRIPGYTEQEKVAIAQRYILERQLKENGLQKGDVLIPDPVMIRIIREYTREAGLRNLEREIGAVCRKYARKVAEGQTPPFRVTVARLPKLLGQPKFLEEEREANLPVGVALGLAWTPYGGEVLHIECTLLPGKGKLILTGKLGDVMKESAQAALSVARARAKDLGLADDFFETHDVHIHVPAGATPKDGPSAGVTMVTALFSALTGRPVAADAAMTGEITLRGRVLPVGGIKEKILAAMSHGVRRVFLPQRNAHDLEEIPKELLRRVEVTLVNTIDEIWPHVLGEAQK
ncbi:Lon protease [Thermodesulfomicrobium sp. WS]|uniref:endopeptidase La n=1 Tax=Thermodesulfomicrobium sp. WS TaxID=3004129 RepID=UPI002492EDF5|nr:endopeptidase La [Thermodesulfomicrobium sp. WS]BDV00747.1 Lon protease [Thermodesulfomicrobium sp. WS]